ncbi:GATA zinc finger domain-containing protein 14-like [Papaver somniferum]|uniref:GATA zinc finger domain-containing protein 14-like n=1 Tax=Papaver somniferum TaxID=3469 RepID=UPI000E6FAF86|nr:GATA zinc finger domain-containing protein 14-like [Papaver somniferum]
MASAKHFYLFFLVFLFSSGSLQIHARDSQFFSKFTRVNTVPAAANNTDGINNNADNVKETAEILPKEGTPVAEAPLNSEEMKIPASSENKEEEKPSLSKQVEEANNGHSLYGHGSGQFPPTTTETSDNDAALDSMTYAELPDEENFSEEFGTTASTSSDQGGGVDQSKSTKDGYPYHNNNNVYEGKQFGLADAQFGTGNVDENHYHNYNNKRNHDEQQLEKQGMSDTRFLENGKYYYHVGAANPNVNTHNDEYYKHISGAEFVDHSAVQEQNEGSHYGVADKIANNNNVYEGKQFGLSDAQFSTDNVNNNQNYEQQIEKQGMSDRRFPENGQRYDGSAVNNNKYQPIKRQGMSDTRFQEHGRYYKTAHSSDNNMYQQGEKQGMSDTRFLANGKYYYHVEAANPKVDTHNDEYSKHIDGAEFIQHSAVQQQNEGSYYGTSTGSSSSPMRMDSSRFRNQEQQQRNNNDGYYNNSNGNSFDRQYSNSNSNNNGNSFDRQYSNSDSNSNYYPMDQEMNNNFDDDNQLGPQGEYIP